HDGDQQNQIYKTVAQPLAIHLLPPDGITTRGDCGRLCTWPTLTDYIRALVRSFAHSSPRNDGRSELPIAGFALLCDGVQCAIRLVNARRAGGDSRSAIGP